MRNQMRVKGNVSIGRRILLTSLTSWTTDNVMHMHVIYIYTLYISFTHLCSG
uniref:Uncharacterized protein n=1 Tax=Ascaris lumbricoides TaxID=6252 RepID=A0A0M3IV24_ASCLU